MMDFFQSSYLLPTLTGLLLFGVGLLARLGYLKRMFIQKKVTGIFSRNTPYALMPAGLFLLSFYPISLWKGERPTEDLDALIILVVLFVSPLVFLIWQPRWLKPAWLQWLEENHGSRLEKIFAAARKIGPREWEAQVKTQDDLQRWVNRIALR
jgi:hypothetical protein